MNSLTILFFACAFLSDVTAGAWLHDLGNRQRRPARATIGRSSGVPCCAREGSWRRPAKGESRPSPAGVIGATNRLGALGPASRRERGPASREACRPSADNRALDPFTQREPLRLDPARARCGDNTTRTGGPGAPRGRADGLGRPASASVVLIGQELGLMPVFRIGVDAFDRDRQRAILGSPDPALFLQIPEMKLQMLVRTA